ncbi:MAG: DUF5667 domain-containing protein [Candidatus Ratteibacteria bacterium]|nr:DUF5667 domain-containing protein [Candidatus Ratteibacteria bacterium]
MKAIYILLFLIAFAAVPAMAQEATTSTSSISNQLNKVDWSMSAITPGNVLYDVKTTIEDIQELIERDPTRKLLLKQSHLNARIKELEIDAKTQNSKNAAKILQKLQTKRMEIDSALEDLKPRCADTETGEITACKEFDTNSSKKKIYEAVKRQNFDVLGKLLVSEKMPAQAKIGLQNAINKSGLKAEVEEPKAITANMVQTYKSTAISYVPFRTAMMTVKGSGKQYAIVLGSKEVTISDEMILSSPDYYIFPTQGQFDELKGLAESINTKKKLSWQDSMKLMNLWMEMEKKAGG